MRGIFASCQCLGFFLKVLHLPASFGRLVDKLGSVDTHEGRGQLSYPLPQLERLFEKLGLAAID